MRCPFARFPGRVGLAVSAALLGCSQPQITGPQDMDVHVTIACTAGQVNATVNGWVIRKNRTDNRTVTVLFSGGGPGGSDLTVTPKDPAQWPFTPQPTVNGSYVLQNNGRLNLTVDATAEPGTYRYTIVGRCTIDASTHSITIDPDIVVD